MSHHPGKKKNMIVKKISSNHFVIFFHRCSKEPTRNPEPIPNQIPNIPESPKETFVTECVKIIEILPICRNLREIIFNRMPIPYLITSAQKLTLLLHWTQCEIYGNSSLTKIS